MCWFRKFKYALALRSDTDPRSYSNALLTSTVLRSTLSESDAWLAAYRHNYTVSQKKHPRRF